MTLRPIAVTIALLVAISALPCSAIDLPAVVRGAATVLLMPEPGPLTITLRKRDLNIYDGPDAMPVSVRDPLGEEVVALTIPDDGDLGRGAHGPLQEETVTIQVERRGLYRVLFTGGDCMAGMAADCDRYVIRSKLVFNDPNTALSVHFPPPQGAFTVAAAPLHGPGVQTVSLHDAAGALLHQFALVKPVEDVPFDVAEGAGSRDGLWRWEVGKADVILTVPGVTHWTTDPASFFDPSGSHLVLAPRNTARYAQPGGAARFRIMLYPPPGYTGGFDARITQPEADGVRFELADPPAQPVEYASDRLVVPVTALVEEGRARGGVFNGNLEVVAADNPLAAASARLQVRVGPSPVAQPLSMPIVLRPYEHEDWQFGYAPEFEPNEVCFDRANRAWIRHRTEHRHWSAGAQVLEGDGWAMRPWTDALRERFPGYQRPSSGSGFNGCRWAFDDDGGAWTVMRLAGSGSAFTNAILYTPDRGQSWQAELIDGELADIEVFSGHNDPGLPPVLAYRRTAAHPAKFCAYYDLLLYLPRVEDGRLVVPEPILVSDNCFGGCVHSGAPPTLATRDGRTHIVWGEVTDPGDPGVPTYIATYDHATRKLSEKVLIAHAPPVNDVHNAPAVVLDSEGVIHVVTGAHGANFLYARSLLPGDISGGFTEPEKVLDAGWVDGESDEDGSGRQTYTGLVCDAQDTLHIVYRQNRSGVDDYLPELTYYMGLSHQRKPNGEPWGPAQPLVIPPVGGYSIYYHKLTVDRLGRLYVSYSHWTDQAYSQDFPGLYHNRALIASADGGDTWKLAETTDFVDAAERYEER